MKTILVFCLFISIAFSQTSCQNDTDCGRSPFGYTCNLETNTCGCSNSTCDDGSYGLFCDAEGSKQCGCRTDDDCKTTWGAKCNTTNSQCYCATDADCDARFFAAFGGSCIVEEGRCGCKSSFDCARSYVGAWCNATSHMCACNSNAQCPMSAGGGLCPFEYRTCGCYNDTQCVGNEYGGICNDINYCGCNTDADCATAGAGSACFAQVATKTYCGCNSDADCIGDSSNGPLCDTVALQCVECLADTDCTGQASICHPSLRLCVGCLADTDCSGGQICGAESRTCQTPPAACTGEDCPEEDLRCLPWTTNDL